MPDESPSLKAVLDDLLMVFPFVELHAVLREMGEPLNCENTAEMFEILERNMEILTKKQEQAEEGGRIADKATMKQYVDNPSNFTAEQWDAIQRTKIALRDYEREVDMAMESGKIKKVAMEGREELKKKRRKRARRHKKRKNWISL